MLLVAVPLAVWFLHSANHPAWLAGVPVAAPVLAQPAAATSTASTPPISITIVTAPHGGTKARVSTRSDVMNRVTGTKRAAPLSGRTSVSRSNLVIDASAGS